MRDKLKQFYLQKNIKESQTETIKSGSILNND